MKLIRNKKKQQPKEEKTVETQSISPGEVMKIQRPKQSPTLPTARPEVWKILVVDDEPEIHAVTKLSIGDLKFEHKKLELLSAMSGEEARKILIKEPDIAVALIDIVMETEDAGLRLVEFIRNELDNQRIRLIIRTGQPGAAPERYVIDHYDIDDYKEKTELTTQRLYATLRTILKAYRDLTIIDINRQGLEKILTAAPDLYRLQPMEHFLEGILTQITSLCPIGKNSLIATINSAIAMPDEDSNVVEIRAGTGKFIDNHNDPSSADIITQTCESILRNKSPKKALPENSLLLPMALHDNILGFIYLEEVSFLTDDDRSLIQIMATQCAAALKNLYLYNHLEKANQQNERKNQFLGMAAHDLRNPITVIQGYGELLKSDISDKLDTEQLEYLNGVQSASYFMERLVDDLLDVAKIESGKWELECLLTDILPIVREAVSYNAPLAKSKQIEIVIDYEDNLPKTMIDASKIQQVLNNLLSNAIKYSHAHTRVYVRISLDENNFLISLKDQGQGIPKKEQEKLFKAFSKTSVQSTGGEKSTGLGLLICRQIVEAHEGKIWVESEIGVGSTFYISLPIRTR
jgi:signal transduction histidine kinase/CheY-like chemotaxis protein